MLSTTQMRITPRTAILRGMPVRRLTMDDSPSEDRAGTRRLVLTTPIGEPDGVDVAWEISRERQDER
ncbi:MAG TPA: hypothetical protein VFI00_06280 [Kribbella sp.]|nr:hypothetical protein [Kribbella sp.]